MASSKEKNDLPAGGWFGTIGFVIGMVLVWDFTEDWIATFIGGIVMAYVGVKVEILTYKLFIFFMAIIAILIRKELLGVIFEALSGN